MRPHSTKGIRCDDFIQVVRNEASQEEAASWSLVLVRFLYASLFLHKPSNVQTLKHFPSII